MATRNLCGILPIMIFTLLAVFSLLPWRTKAMDCINITGYNLQCPRLTDSVCLPETGMLLEVLNISAYDLLCDGNNNCTATGADEGHPELSPSLMCDTRTFQCHGSRETLPLEALCNGTAECIDGVDEINPLCADKCFGEYQGGCLELNRACAVSRALSRDCGDCLEGFYQVEGLEACVAIPLIVTWENSTFQLVSTSMVVSFVVCFMAEIDTSVVSNTTFPAQLGNRIVSLSYTTSTSGGDILDTTTVDVSNDTIGQNCVTFTPGFVSGVIENDQTFTIELQDLQMPTEVEFPSGQTATVEVLERETFMLTTSSGTSSSNLVASEGDTVEICFISSSNITRTSLVLDLEVVASYTDATINDDFQLSGPTTATTSMGNTLFCFNVTVVNDNEYDGLTQEQITLAPFSVSTPDLLQPPVPNVTITILDNDSVTPFLRSINDTSAPEGGSIVFELVLQGFLEANLTLMYQISFINGTASGSDVSPTSSNVTFTEDGLPERATEITVSFLDDMIVEGDEIVMFSLLETNSTIELTITDETIANVSFDQASYTTSVSSTSITLGVVVADVLETSITLDTVTLGISGVRTSGPVTLTEGGVVSVTLYFDNVTMTGLDQVFTVDLVLVDTGNGVSIQTTPSLVTLQPVELTFSFNETMVSVAEGMMVTVVINIDTGVVPGNLTLAITDGTTTMSDYSVPSPLVATQTEDSTVYTAVLTIIDDDIIEGDEYFTLSVIDPPGMENYTKNITIEDNDKILLEWTQQTFTGLESSGELPFNVNITIPAGGLVNSLVLTISFQDITATGGGVDYDSATVAITIDPGMSGETVIGGNVTITDDNFVEPTETFLSTLSLSESIISNDSVTTATMMILDDDVAVIAFDQPAYTISVESTNITLGIAVNGTLQTNITVVTVITDIEGVRSSGPVTLREGGMASVTLYFDNVTMTGLDQVFTVDLVPVDIEVGVTFQTIPSNITLQPIELTISFNETMVSVAEGMMVTVVINIDTGVVPGNLTLAITDGTTMMSDYSVPSPLIATSTEDSTVYTVVLTIIDDDIIEGDEYFTLSVIDPPGIENYTKNITIEDNDKILLEWTQQTFTGLESSGELPFNVNITIPAGGLVNSLVLTISFQDITATGGGVDYDSATVAITIDPGMSGETVIGGNVTITDDNFVEPTETFLSTLSLSESESVISNDSVTTATMMILDDDVAVIAFDRPAYTISVESINITLGIAVNGTLQTNITVVTVITDIEGVRSSGPVTLREGGMASVTLYFDNVTMTGLDQVFTVDLVPVDIEVGVAFQTIPSNITLQPIELTISFNESMVSVAEGMMVTVVINIDTGIVAENLTLAITDGTTTMSDYSVPSQLMASPTEDSSVYTFTLTIIDDDVYEGEEYFTLSVVDPPGLADYNTSIIIQDNEELNIQVIQPQYTVLESSSSVSVGFVVIVSMGGLERPLIFTVTFQDNSAIGGEDYNSSDITATVSPSALNVFSVTVDVPITDDSFVEDTETFSFSVTSPQALAITAMSTTTGTVDIVDDDVAMISFDQLSYTISVENTEISLGIFVSSILQTNITVETNISGIEGVRSSGPVTLTEGGMASVTLYFDNVTMTGLDQVFTVDLVLVDTGNGVSIQTTPSTVTLQPVEVSTLFNQTTLSVEEGTMVTVVINIDMGIVVGNLTLMITDGTTTMMDYSVPSQIIATPTEDPSVYTASLTIFDDDIYEGEEYFTLSVVDPPGMENYTKTITIQDNEELTIQFNEQEITAEESSSSIRIMLTLVPPSGGLAIPVNLVVDFQDLSATGGTDYDNSNITVEVPPTSMPYTSYITVNITDDSIAEIPERFMLTVETSAVLSTSSNTTMMIEIQDDDELAISFDELEYTVDESDDQVMFNVTITSAGGWANTLQFDVLAQDNTAVAGDDYIQNTNFTTINGQYPDSTLTFPVMLEIVDDNIMEETESLTLTLQLVTQINVRNDSNLTATVIIEEDEGPITVNFEQNEFTATEGRMIALALDINRGQRGNQSFIPQQDLQVTFTDGTLVPRCEEMGSGSASGGGLASGRDTDGYYGDEAEDICLVGIMGETVYLMINDDNFVEGNETVAIMLVLRMNNSFVDIQNGTIYVTIVDDDELVVTFTMDSYMVQEGNDTVEVCVMVTEGRLDTDGLAEVLVMAVETSNATESVDYRPLNSTLSITYSNQNEMQCLNISDYIIDDNVPEYIEEFNLSLSVVQTSFPSEQLIFFRPTTTIIIVNDDTADVSLGDDPHFSVVLPSKKLLCFSVQGEHGFSYNLISNKYLVMNAMFVPDSLREEVTWIGSLGLIFHGSTFAKENMTSIRLTSSPPLISINSNVKLHPRDIELITVIDGKLRVTEKKFTKGFTYPSVKFTVAGISFSTVFKREHLDLFWHSTQQQTENSHGIIGQFFHKGVVIDTVRKILIMPNKEPVPVMRRPVWSFMERETVDDQLCWTAMNPGYQGEGLIDGSHSDYIVKDILTPMFRFNSNKDDL